jgi:hypothetical protein
MKDVTRKAGVSVTSVSHALNGTRFVLEDAGSLSRFVTESGEYLAAFSIFLPFEGPVSPHKADYPLAVPSRIRLYGSVKLY